MSERVLGNHPDAGPGLSTSSDGGSAAPPHRRVASFVHQRNRLTEGQAHAWDRLLAGARARRRRLVAGRVAYDPPAWFGRRAPLVLEIGSGIGRVDRRAGRRGTGGRPPRRRGLRTRARPAAHADRRGRPDQPAAAPRRRRRPAARARAARLPGRDTDLLPRPVAQAAAPQAPARAARSSSRSPPPASPRAASCTWPPTGRTTRSRCGRPARGEPLLENASAAADGWTPRPDGRPETKFERRARMEGRDVRDLVFRRISAPQSFTH